MEDEKSCSLLDCRYGSGDFLPKKDAFILVIAVLQNWHALTGVLTILFHTIIFKIPEKICQLTIAMNSLGTSLLGHVFNWKTLWLEFHIAKYFVIIATIRDQRWRFYFYLLRTKRLDHYFKPPCYQQLNAEKMLRYVFCTSEIFYRKIRHGSVWKLLCSWNWFAVCRFMKGFGYISWYGIQISWSYLIHSLEKF